MSPPVVSTHPIKMILDALGRGMTIVGEHPAFTGRDPVYTVTNCCPYCFLFCVSVLETMPKVSYCLSGPLADYAQKIGRTIIIICGHNNISTIVVVWFISLFCHQLIQNKKLKKNPKVWSWWRGKENNVRWMMRGSSCCNQGGHGRVKCVSNQAESLPSIYIYVTFFNLSNISFPPPSSAVVYVVGCCCFRVSLSRFVLSIRSHESSL